MMMERPAQTMPRQEDSSYNIQEETREQYQGTPNDVRMLSNKRGASSQSIPIASQKLSPSELELREGEALAEYRDYCMYRRITEGKQSKSLESRQAGAALQGLRPASSMQCKFAAPHAESLHDIVRAQHNARLIPEQQPHAPLMIPIQQNSMFLPNGYPHFQGAPVMAAEALSAPTDDFEEEGIFDLEL